MAKQRLVKKKYYTTPEPERLVDACKLLWDLPKEADIGPVDTNFFVDQNSSVELVIVLESPSENEVELGMPAVGTTGANIWKLWHISQEKELKYKYSLNDFDEIYKLFAENGIYLTNLVRCQANYGLNNPREKEQQKIKNTRVKEAFPLNRRFLVEELTQIAHDFPNVCILFACGKKFNKEIKQVMEVLRGLNIQTYSTYHPSSSKAIASDYNPSNWRKEN